MTTRQAIDQIFLLYGYELPETTPLYIRERSIIDLNAALQELAMAPALTGWLSDTVSFPVAPSQSAVSLADDVQNVPGPVRWAHQQHRPLRRLASQGELDGWANFGGTDAGVPRAWFLEERRVTADNPLALRVLLSSAPSAPLDLLVDVEYSRPPIVWADYFEESAALPVPHRYVETLFMPLARASAATFPQFLLRSNPETAQAIAAAAAAARAAFGLPTPPPPHQPQPDAAKPS